MEPVVWPHWTAAKAPSMERVGGDLAVAAQALPDWHLELEAAPRGHECGWVDCSLLHV